MVVEIARGGEPLPADPALMRLLSGVDPTVGVQARAGGEALAADVAHVRPLPRVNPDVPLQQGGSVESFPTVIAREHVLLSPPHDRGT